MKVVVLYKPHGEHARIVEDFAKDFSRLHGGTPIELLDAESIDGVQVSQLYDILQYPAVLILTNDGKAVNYWVGENLPLMNEVAGYLFS